MSAAGLTWRSYEESMPSRCDLSSVGTYAVKHNPAAYYTDIRAHCRRWDVPMGTVSAGPFASALHHSHLPSFAFVTPNLCDDMHDCSVATGDAWLRTWVSAIIASESYRAGATVVFITFDEGTASSNQVATVVVAPSTPSGTRSTTAFTHYSLLVTTEELLGIHMHLAHAGLPTRGMRSAFHL